MDAVIEGKEFGKLFTDNFVIVKLDVSESKDKKDLENPGGGDVMKELGGAESGLPFYAWLDAKGNKIADSNIMPGRVKNIGYPAAPQEIDAFEKLIKQTAPKMKAADRDKLIAHLRQIAPKQN